MLHTSPATYNSLRVEQPSRMDMSSTPTPPSTPGSKRKDLMTCSTSSSIPHHPHQHHHSTSSNNGNSNGNSNAASPASTPKLARRFQKQQQQHQQSSSSNSHAIPRTFSYDSQQAAAAATAAGVSDFTSYGGAGISVKENSLYQFDEVSCARDTGGYSNRYSFYNETPDFSVDGERASITDDASSMHICGRRHLGNARSHDFNLSADGGNGNSNSHALYSLQNPKQGQGHSHFRSGSSSADDSVEKCHRWLQGLKLTKADKMKSRSHIQLPPV